MLLRNQAKFLPEWIILDAHVGVERWFIYDDDIKQAIGSLTFSYNYRISCHLWPYVKTQEAGFAHCALLARSHCSWVGCIDVNEFLYLPTALGELRKTCYNFGASGRKTTPLEGLMVGYTCWVLAHEQHKSIVRPEALDSSLINAVHHFQLKEGMRYVNMDKELMVINHYKYQVWEVFKERFHCRVATYVADW